MKVQQADEAVTPLEQAEGSQASTTSAEPSLSAPEPSGIHALLACTQPLFGAVPLIPGAIVCTTECVTDA